MGIYLNPGNVLFEKFIQNDIYVDKTGIIPELIKIFECQNQYICVSRPRRFGKTVICNMLTAYFSKGCDSSPLFAGSIGSKDPLFEKYLNKVNVIKIDMNSEFQNEKDTENFIDIFSTKINVELQAEFPQVKLNTNDSLANCILEIYNQTKETFVILIDEYDVLVRESVTGSISESLFKKYLSFLNGLFKSSTLQPAITLAYLTVFFPLSAKNSSPN